VRSGITSPALEGTDEPIRSTHDTPPRRDGRFAADEPVLVVEPA
jgi:hypothetical protein